MPGASYRAELAAYLALRSRVPLHDVSVNGHTVVLHVEDELPDAQVGFGVDADGDDITSDGPGGWQPAWLVVATEEPDGLPLVADLALAGFPVLSVTWGPDGWDADLVAESFERFAGALEAVAEAGDVLDPVSLEALYAAIDRANPSASLVFWEYLLEED